MPPCSEKHYHKTVIINRAVSGSGKSTLACCLTEALSAHGLTVRIHSTDDFFMQNGNYVFDKDKLEDYHRQNQAAFRHDLDQGIDVVICDNMNLIPWQTWPYTNAARRFHYKIIFLNLFPRALADHVAVQVHGLPQEHLEKLIREFHKYNDRLIPRTAFSVMSVSENISAAADANPAVPRTKPQGFDCDHVISIQPEQFLASQTTLAEQILAIMSETD